LGLNERASDIEIKKMYRKLILIWHPDKNINNKEESEKKTKEITKAYRIILEYREKFKKTKSKNTKPKKTNAKPKQRKPRQPKPKQTNSKQTKFNSKNKPKEQQKSTKTNSNATEADKAILNFFRIFLNTYHDSK
ncbi:6280_t:CDS:1, partial [Scutellospora calospora]